MGKALLGGLSEEALEEYLVSAELRSYTPRTITNIDVLRAEVAQARRQGWAIADEELEDGLCAIAVPLLDHTGATIAAVNVTTSIVRHSVASLTLDLLPPLRATAAQIESDLGTAPPSASYR
jgi:IclR family pca regulon transcriptional regulator